MPVCNKAVNKLMIHVVNANKMMTIGVMDVSDVQ